MRAHQGERTFRILDVGGHSSPLKHFLPDDEIVLLDVEAVGSLTSVEFRFDEYVRGSGAALPFRDGSFDIVSAHDTLEHVPPEFRLAFLANISAVASRNLIVGGPLATADVAQAEERLDAFVKKTLGWEQPFLAEHIDLGLPDPRLIETFFEQHGMPFISLPSGNLERWLLMQAFRHYLAALPDTEGLREDVDRMYNSMYFESDNDGPCYRHVYVVAKGEGDRQHLQSLAKGFDVREPVATRFAEIEGLLSGLEGHADSIREHLSGLHQRIFAAEQAEFEMRNGRDEALAALRVREEEVVRQQEMIGNLDAKLNEIRRFLPYRVYRGLRKSVRRLTGRGQ